MSLLHVFILFIAFLFLLQTPVNCHICTYIITGQFSELQLKSFSHTRHHVESDLLLFASDQVYWIDRKTITPNSFIVPDQSYGWTSTKSYYSLKDLKVPDDGGQVEAVYLINNERESVWQSLVLTEKYQTVYDWKGTVLNQRERESSYSLVLNEWGHGYVFQVDEKRKPKEVAIYDFHYTIPSKSEAIIPHIIPQSATSTSYFYLYRALVPNTVRFIHLAHFEDQKRDPVFEHRGPLFETAHPPPPGFIHNGLVYLFDVSQGCVYVFEYYPDLEKQLASVTSFLYPRMNIPFERFFLCSERFFRQASDFSQSNVKLDDDRCQKDPKWKIPSVNSSQKMEHSTNYNTVVQVYTSLSWSFITSGALVFTIIFCGIVYLLKCREEDPALSESAHWDYEPEETKKKRKKTRKRKTKQKTRERKHSPTS